MFQKVWATGYQWPCYLQASFLGQFYSLSMSFLGRCSMFLTSPTSWVLHCPVRFMLHALSSQAYCPASQTFFCNLGRGLHDPTTLSFCMSIKPAFCEWCQRLLPAGTFSLDPSCNRLLLPGWLNLDNTLWDFLSQSLSKEFNLLYP